MNVPPLPTRRSSWRFLLPVVWLGLAARLAVALAHHEPIRNDFLSLALVAFLMSSALLGSRIWLWIHDRWDEMHARHEEDVSVQSAARS